MRTFCIRVFATTITVTLVFLLHQPCGLSAREWTDVTGKFRVEAELVDFNEGVVRLKKKETGEVISVPINRLSKESRERIRSVYGGNRFKPSGDWLSSAIDSSDREYPLELLRAHPSFATYRNEVGWTPLHAAARAGRKDVVAALLELKADTSVNQKDGVGSTPLHHACDCKNLVSEDYVEIVEMLIASKAEVNALDDDFRRTPLHRAAAPATPTHLKVATILLKNGAAVDIKDSNGATALDLAVANHAQGIKVSQEAVDEMVKLLKMKW